MSSAIVRVARPVALPMLHPPLSTTPPEVDYAAAPGLPAITEIRSVRGFAALRDEWTALHLRSAAQVPALTWDWLFTWWEVFGAGRQLRLLVARDGDRLIGVAPLLSRTVLPRGVPIRRIELLATGEREADEILSEYLEFVIERGRETEVISACWRHLAADPEWDELRLASVPVESLLVAELRAAAAGMAVDITAHRRADSVAVTLAPDANQFMAGQTRRMREDLRRHRRMIEKHGRVTLERAETVEQLRAMFPTFVRLHQEVWVSRGMPGCFASEAFTRFHMHVSERMFARGLVHLYLLKVGERPIAARYGFHSGDRLYEYQSGVDPTFEPRISTGVQAAQLCMEAAIARGFATYDLGEGPRPYKLRWNHVRRLTENVSVTRRNSRTRAHAVLVAIEARLRALKRAWAGKRTSGNGAGGHRDT